MKAFLFSQNFSWKNNGSLSTMDTVNITLHLPEAASGRLLVQPTWYDQEKRYVLYSMCFFNICNFSVFICLGMSCFSVYLDLVRSNSCLNSLLLLQNLAKYLF